MSQTRARLQSSFEGGEWVRVQSRPPLCFHIKVLWRSRRNSKWSSIQFVFHYLYNTCANVLVVIIKVVNCHNPDSDKCSHFFAKAFPYLRFVGHSIYIILLLKQALFKKQRIIVIARHLIMQEERGILMWIWFNRKQVSNVELFFKHCAAGKSD